MEINKKYVTKKALQDMIDIHSKEYIKAVLDHDEFSGRVAKLEEDWNLVADENKTRVLQEIDKRIENPEAPFNPPTDLQAAISTKLTLDAMKEQLKKSTNGLNTFPEIIDKLKKF